MSGSDSEPENLNLKEKLKKFELAGQLIKVKQPGQIHVATNVTTAPRSTKFGVPVMPANRTSLSSDGKGDRKSIEIEAETDGDKPIEPASVSHDRQDVNQPNLEDSDHQIVEKTQMKEELTERLEEEECSSNEGEISDVTNDNKDDKEMKTEELEIISNVGHSDEEGDNMIENVDSEKTDDIRKNDVDEEDIEEKDEDDKTDDMIQEKKDIEIFVVNVDEKVHEVSDEEEDGDDETKDDDSEGEDDDSKGDNDDSGGENDDSDDNIKDDAKVREKAEDQQKKHGSVSDDERIDVSDNEDDDDDGEEEEEMITDTAGVSHTGEGDSSDEEEALDSEVIQEDKESGNVPDKDHVEHSDIEDNNDDDDEDDEEENGDDDEDEENEDDDDDDEEEEKEEMQQEKEETKDDFNSDRGRVGVSDIRDRSDSDDEDDDKDMDSSRLQVPDDRSDDDDSTAADDVDEDDVDGDDSATPAAADDEDDVEEKQERKDDSDDSDSDSDFVDAEENLTDVGNQATWNVDVTGQLMFQQETQTSGFKEVITSVRTDFLGARTVYQNVDETGQLKHLQDFSQAGPPENVHEQDETSQHLPGSANEKSSSSSGRSSPECEKWIPPLQFPPKPEPPRSPEDSIPQSDNSLPPNSTVDSTAGGLRQVVDNQGPTPAVIDRPSWSSGGAAFDGTVYQNVKLPGVDKVPPPVPERSYRRSKDLSGQSSLHPPYPEKSGKTKEGIEKAQMQHSIPPPVPVKSYRKSLPPPVPERTYRPGFKSTRQSADQNLLKGNEEKYDVAADSMMFGSDEYQSVYSTVSADASQEFMSLPVYADRRMGVDPPTRFTNSETGVNQNESLGVPGAHTPSRMPVGFPSNLPQDFFNDPRIQEYLFKMFSLGQQPTPAGSKSHDGSNQVPRTSGGAGIDPDNKSPEDPDKKSPEDRDKTSLDDPDKSSSKGTKKKGANKKSGKETDKKNEKPKKLTERETEKGKKAKEDGKVKGTKATKSDAKQKKSIKKSVAPCPEPVMDTYICVSNLNPITQVTTLRDFLESKTEPEVDCSNVVYNENRTVAVVPFMGSVDAEDLNRKCQLKKIGDNVVEVSEVERVRHIIISCDQEMPESQGVKNYFKRVAGNVVQYKARTDGCYSVKFDSQNAVKTACGLPVHKIGNVKINVTPFYFTDNGEVWDQTKHKVHLPEPITITDLNADLQQFVNRNSDLENKMNNEFESAHAKVSLTDCVTIECLLDQKYPKVRQLVKEWDSKIQQKWKEYVDENLKRIELEVANDVWARLAECAKDCQESHSKILILQKEEETLFVFVGECASVDDTYNKLLIDKGKIEADILRKSQITTITKKYPESAHLKLLERMGIFLEVNKIEDDLNVTLDDNLEEVHFKGVPEDIATARVHIEQTIFQIEKCTVLSSDLSLQQISLLKTEALQTMLAQEFESQGLLVELESQENGIKAFVLNEDNKPVDAVRNIICNLTSQKIIQLDETALAILSSDDWEREIDDIKQANVVDITATNDARIIITTVSDVHANVVQRIQDFIEEHSIYVDIIDIHDEGKMKFIVKFCNNELDRLQDDLRKQSLKLEVLDGHINMSATKQGLKEARREISQIIDNITHRKHTVNRPGITRVIGPDAENLIDIEEETNTIILFVDPTIDGRGDHSRRNAQNVSASSFMSSVREETMSESKRKTSTQTMAKESVAMGTSTLPTFIPPNVGPYKCANGIQIKLTRGELAKQMADVIVCSTSQDLKLSSGASGRNLVDVGGQTLLDDIKAKYPSGVKVGDLAVITGGNLKCKDVYLGCLPEWKSDAGNNPKTMYTFIEKCLTAAAKTGHKCIVFAALGTGQLHYPKGEAADIMYQGVIDFDKSNKTSSIQEVQFLCYHKDHDTCNAFEDIEYQKLNPGRPKRNRGSYKTKHGVKISIVKEEIGKHKADVLVCAVTKQLKLQSGGAAQSLYSKGGDSLQAECTKKYPNGIGQYGELASVPGTNMDCQEVYLTALPDDEKLKQTTLCQFVYKCMEKADKNGHRSVAYAAMGTGKIGYKKDIVAQNFYSEVRRYSYDHPGCSVKDVRFILHPKDFDTIRAFEKEQASKLAKAQTYTGTCVTPKCKITVTVETESITKKQADVLVVTAKPKLDLSQGGVCQNVLKEGGQTLQDQCSSQYPAGIKVGDIAMVTGGNLPCQKIYIGTLPVYNEDQQAAEKALENFAVKCLEQAEKSGYTSVVFPCLGSGYNGFQHSKSAALLFNAVKRFDGKYSSSALKEVSFVAKKTDRRSLAAFQNEEYRYKTALADQSMSAASSSTSSLASSIFGAGASVAQTLRRTFMSSTETLPQSVRPKKDVKQNEVVVGNLTISVSKGDITEENVDAIINSTNDDLDFSMGGVSKVLKSKCDKKMLDSECKAKLAEMKKNQIAVTSSCGIKNFKHIIHVVNQDRLTGWRKLIKACLEEAEQLNCTVVAFPVVGTGGGFTKFAPDKIGQTFMQAVSDFGSGHANSTLTKVKIVAYQDSMVSPLLSGLQTTPEPTGIWQGARDFIAHLGFTPRTGTAVNTSVLALLIYGQLDHDIDSAILQIENKIDSKYTKTETRDTLIVNLKKDELKQLEDLKNQFNIIFTVDKQNSTVVYEGPVTEVTDAKHEVHKLLNYFQHERFLDEEAEFIATTVQWSVMVLDQGIISLVPYPNRQNMDLENARKKNDVQYLKFVTEDGEITVDILNMKEYPSDKINDTTDVVRKEILTGGVMELPTNWTEMKDPKEIVRPVNVPQSSQEYIQIEKQFKDSVLQGIYNANPPNANHVKGQFNNVKVHKIERIQNPSLYQQYAVKRETMEKNLPKGTKIEQSLWHGAPPTALVSINYYGFNRSYCGNNAGQPWFGNGVYFANDASYSARDWVSGKDAAGKKHMYLTKVLTGMSCPGKQGMKVLPERIQGQPFDSAVDKLPNSMEFIIFNDTQAYPEYCIQFTI